MKMNHTRVFLCALAVCLAAAGSAPAAVVKLNNLCWEVLNVAPGGAPPPSYTFDNPRNGWVYFVIEAKDNLTLTVPDADPQPICRPGAGARQEAMRWMSAGSHQINVGGAGALNRLIARSVAAAYYCCYGDNARVTQRPAYDWDFLKQYVLDSANTMTCKTVPNKLEDWKALGGQWIQYLPIEAGQNATAQAVYDYLSGQPGITDPRLKGAILDEFSMEEPAQTANEWRAGCDRVLNEHPDKFIISFVHGRASAASGPMNSFLQTLVNHGSYVAWECYIEEQRTPSEMASSINSHLGGQMAAWERYVPGATQHMIVTLGYFSDPLLTLSVNPGANFRVRMDMEFNHLATDSRFDGLGGIMEWASGYCNDEYLRWTGRLFRHYVLEGNRSMLGSDPYILTHIQNPDFEDGVADWTITQAEPDSVTTASWPGYSSLQGRYPPTSQGDTFLVMRRCPAAPNLFSQQIKNLQPGRYYSLKMFTGDYQELLDGVSTNRTHGISIAIDNTEMLGLPSTDFSCVYPNEIGLWVGPFNSPAHRYYTNMHSRVFKALGTTATLRVSDWANPTNIGGPIGQKLAFNYIEIQPYLSAFERDGQWMSGGFTRAAE